MNIYLKSGSIETRLTGPVAMAQAKKNTAKCMVQLYSEYHHCFDMIVYPALSAMVWSTYM